MVMEYLDGETLDDAMARGDRFAVAEVCDWLRPVAAALDATHAAGVLHRDVKPANVVRARGADGDRVKLIDFGLAVLEDAPADMRLTGAGTFVGTPTYLAPEVATGEAVDARCDVYSLACVAYEMLTGRAPHARETTMATLTAKLTEPAPAPSSILGDAAPAGLDPLFARALAMDPDERPASASAFLRELVRVAEGRARRPAPTLPPASKAAPARRKPTGLWLALAATIATVLFALWMTGPAFAEQPSKQRPVKLET
jgi:serine/threonine-protein kinase